MFIEGNVAASEDGGITQKLSAFCVDVKDRYRNMHMFIYMHIYIYIYIYMNVYLPLYMFVYIYAYAYAYAYAYTHMYSHIYIHKQDGSFLRHTGSRSLLIYEKLRCMCD
jgi:hypothetical protein